MLAMLRTSVPESQTAEEQLNENRVSEAKLGLVAWPATQTDEEQLQKTLKTATESFDLYSAVLKRRFADTTKSVELYSAALQKAKPSMKKTHSSTHSKTINVWLHLREC